MHLLVTVLTIPPQPINTLFRAFLFQHNPDCVLESYRVMRNIGWEQKHVTLMNMDVLELLASGLGGIHDFEKHGAFVLVKPLSGFIDVVVGSLIWAANDHYCHVIVVDTIVVDRGLEHVRVFSDPRDCELDALLATLFSDDSRAFCTISEYLEAGRAFFVMLLKKSCGVHRKLRTSGRAAVVKYGKSAQFYRKVT